MQSRRSLAGRLGLPAALCLVLAIGCSDDRAPGGGVGGGGDADAGKQAEGEGEGSGEGEGEGEGEGPAEGEGEGSAEGEGEGEGPAEGEGEGPGGRAVEVAPERIDFGFVAGGRSASRRFQVRSTGTAPLTIGRVATTFDSSRDYRLTDGPQPPVELPPGEAVEYEVTYAQSGGGGDLGTVFIQTDADDAPMRRVELLARQKEGPPDIHVEPPAVRFGQVGVGGEALREVGILNAGGLPLIVSAIGLAPGGSPTFSLPDAQALPLQLQPGNSHSLRVRYAPDAGDDDEGTLVIESNDPNEAVVEVPLSGSGVSDPVPCLRISPNPLRFGAVRRGESAARTAQLISCGVADLHVSRLERSQFFGQALTDEFEITAEPAWPVVLPTGQSAEVEITYSPRLAGLDLGYFVVHNNSPDAQAHLDLQAEGLPPRLEDVALHIQLEWDADNSDVDLHLLEPGGQFFHCPDDCHFANPAPDWGVAGDFHDDPFLDVDNVRGFGPENINLETPGDGTYTVVVHYYRDSYEDSFSTETDATARIFVRGNLVLDETRHLDRTNRTWDVAEIDWPAGDVRPIDNIYMYNGGGGGFCF